MRLLGRRQPLESTELVQSPLATGELLLDPSGVDNNHSPFVVQAVSQASILATCNSCNSQLAPVFLLLV